VFFTIVPLAPVICAGFVGWSWTNVFWMGLVALGLYLSVRPAVRGRIATRHRGQNIVFLSTRYAIELMLVGIAFSMGAVLRVAL